MQSIEAEAKECTDAACRLNEEAEVLRGRGIGLGPISAALAEVDERLRGLFQPLGSVASSNDSLIERVRATAAESMKIGEGLECGSGNVSEFILSAEVLCVKLRSTDGMLAEVDQWQLCYDHVEEMMSACQVCMEISCVS